METKIVNASIQEFNGERFYLCGQYFQRKGKRLHRAVWEYHNGPIPKGYHVHHVDGNRANNSIENLQLIQARDHEQMHALEKADISRELVKNAIAKAPEWHRSAEGLAWHSKQGKHNWKMRTTQTYTCTCCGKEFTTRHIYAPGANHYCHPNCKARYNHHRRKAERVCASRV